MPIRDRPYGTILNMEVVNHPHIVVMKVGIHAREALSAIVRRKQIEENRAGFALWGYGGVLCHPLSQILPFVASLPTDKHVVVCMMFTPSRNLLAPEPAREMSQDGRAWTQIPPHCQVTGSRYALVFRNLRTCKKRIDLGSYAVAVGPSRGVNLANYLRHRIDKACAVYDRSATPTGRPSEIVLTANLVFPYAVFVR